MTLNDFLLWLASSGGAAATMSFVAERIPSFQNLPSQKRSLYILIGSVVIALVAYAVLRFVPAGTLDQLSPFFAIIYSIAGTWVASQVAHKLDPARDAQKP